MQHTFHKRNFVSIARGKKTRSSVVLPRTRTISISHQASFTTRASQIPTRLLQPTAYSHVPPQERVSHVLRHSLVFSRGNIPKQGRLFSQFGPTHHYSSLNTHHYSSLNRDASARSFSFSTNNTHSLNTTGFPKYGQLLLAKRGFHFKTKTALTDRMPKSTFWQRSTIRPNSSTADGNVKYGQELQEGLENPENFEQLAPHKYALNPNFVSEADLIPSSVYSQLRRKISALRQSIKNPRRILVGPNSSVLFMNYDIIFFQISEMLFVEKGGKDQLQDELVAYNPLIPQGNNLFFTFMLEYPSKVVRQRKLTELAGIEHQIFLEFHSKEERISLPAKNASPDLEDAMVDHTGKTSSVHYLRFDFDENQKKSFMETDQVSFQITHPLYLHSTVLPPVTLESLKRDLLQ